MSEFAHLIPEAPTSLSAAEAAAYTQRRAQCLWSLSAAVGEYPDFVPDEYYLALYRGEVAGRWNYDQMQQMLGQHYQLLATGYRHALPTDRLYDIRLNYYQEGEGVAVRVLGAVYDAWRASYQAPAPPVYGPFLAGQTHEQVPARVLPRFERQKLVAEACAQLKAEEHQYWQARRPNLVIPESFSTVRVSAFAQEVLGSYLVGEITAQQAKHLLVEHDDELPSLWMW